MNTLKLDLLNSKIVIDRAFVKSCENPRSEEYALLQRTRQDYPNFQVITRTCKKNPNKESYKGLTYEFMENYIITHEQGEKRLEVLDEYNELRLIAECHSRSRRYPVIKRWFLAKYPEIADFGMIAVPAKSESKPNLELVNNAQEAATEQTVNNVKEAV